MKWTPIDFDDEMITPNLWEYRKHGYNIFLERQDGWRLFCGELWVSSINLHLPESATLAEAKGMAIAMLETKMNENTPWEITGWLNPHAAVPLPNIWERRKDDYTISLVWSSRWFVYCRELWPAGIDLKLSKNATLAEAQHAAIETFNARIARLKEISKMNDTAWTETNWHSAKCMRPTPCAWECRKDGYNVALTLQDNRWRVFCKELWEGGIDLQMHENATLAEAQHAAIKTLHEEKATVSGRPSPATSVKGEKLTGWRVVVDGETIPELTIKDAVNGMVEITLDGRFEIEVPEDMAYSVSYMLAHALKVGRG